MKKLLAAAALGLIGLGVGAASAQTCGGQYVVQRGDTLSSIAGRHYKNAALWTSIHQSNLQAIGSKPNLLRVGVTLQLSCLNGMPSGLPGGAAVNNVELTKATAPTQPIVKLDRMTKVNLLTGDDFAPFTDRGLEEGGLLAEVVTAAMTASVGTEGFQTFWVNDWNSHLNDLMPAGIMEMAYPWARPDCEGDPDQTRCKEFHFSEAMFEYLVLLFVDKSRPVKFETDDDLVGKTICRPLGYLTHMLDKDGRNWVKDDKITLVRPDKVAECFEMLAAGEVDGVVLNEFTGRDAIFSLKMQDQIEPVATKPISITGLHVLIHKNHPHADELLETVNRGLANIKKEGIYQTIVNRHMASIWAGYAAN